MMEQSVTAFIPNYGRPDNVRQIIPVLRAQTIRPKIVLVDNSTGYVSLKAVTGAEDQPDVVWKAPFNAGPFFKFLVAKHYDGWLYFNDDDILPTEEDYLEQMVNLAVEKQASIIGARGRDVRFEPPWYKGLPDSTGWVNNVKMISALMHRDTLSKVRIPPAGWLLRNDDIWVSLETGKGEKVHWVEPALNQQIMDLPQKGVGLSGQKEHYDERSEGVKQWARLACYL